MPAGRAAAIFFHNRRTYAAMSASSAELAIGALEGAGGDGCGSSSSATAVAGGGEGDGITGPTVPGTDCFRVMMTAAPRGFARGAAAALLADRGADSNRTATTGAGAEEGACTHGCSRAATPR